MKKRPLTFDVIDGGLTTSSPKTLPILDKSGTITVGPPMPTQSPLFERVAPLVRVAASSIPGVTSAFVTRDGRDFTITGPEWTPELSAAGARLCVAILQELNPPEGEWVKGGFSEHEDEVPPDCLLVYSKK